MHLLKLFEQTVHILHLNACAHGDAAFACGFDEFRFAALTRCHAVNDALFARNVFFGFAQIHVARFGRQLRGQFVHQTGQATHLFHLLNLRQEIVQIKTTAALDFGRQLLRSFHVHASSDLLHQSQDIAHAQDAACMTFGIKYFKAVNFFAGACKLDGRARDLTH